MDLADPVERDAREEVLHPLPPVELVGPDVVEVEQDAAVGAQRDRRDVLAVGEVTRRGPHVARRRLDEEGPVEAVLVAPDVPDRGSGGLGRRHGGQEVAGVPLRPRRPHPVEGEVLAPVRGLDLAGRERRRRHAVGVRRAGPAHRVPDAVAEQRSLGRAQPPEGVPRDPAAPPVVAVPQCPRLDLEHVDQVLDVGPHEVDPAGDDEPDTSSRWDGGVVM